MRGSSRLAALVVAALAVAGCWPQPRFDAGRTNSNPAESELNPATVGGLEVLWERRVQPEGLEVTGLVAVGDVYATAGNGRVARLDAATGDPVWNTVVDPRQAPIPPHANSPVYFRDRLRVSWGCCRAGVAGTFWLDPADGQITDAPPGGQGAGVNDPAIAQGQLAGWRFSLPHWNSVGWGDRSVAASNEGGSPAVTGGSFAILGNRVYWAPNGNATAFGDQCWAGVPATDPRLSCEPDWRADIGGAGSPIVVGPDAVMWSTASGPTVVDADTGAVRWRAVHDQPVGTRTSAVTDSTIVLSTGDWLVAFPADGCGAPTCEPLWRAPVGGITAVAGGGDLVFATTARGEIAAYGVDGCGAPSCPPLALVDVGDASTGTPVVDDGRLVVGDATGRVIALGLHGSEG